MTDSDRTLSQNLNALARALDELLEEIAGERYGFILLVAPCDRPPPIPVQLVSSFDDDSARAMIETLHKNLTDGIPTVPLHEVQ